MPKVIMAEDTEIYLYVSLKKISSKYREEANPKHLRFVFHTKSNPKDIVPRRDPLVYTVLCQRNVWPVVNMELEPVESDGESRVRAGEVLGHILQAEKLETEGIKLFINKDREYTLVSRQASQK